MQSKAGDKLLVRGGLPASACQAIAKKPLSFYWFLFALPASGCKIELQAVFKNC